MFTLLGSVFIESPASPPQQAQQSTKEDRRAVTMTVYNIELGLIRERRSIRLPAGRVLFRFADVPAGIDPATVQMKPVTEGNRLAVLEQQYKFDLLTPDKLLEKYVGKEVILVDRRMVNNTEQIEERRAVLLSNQQNQQVWRIGDEIVVNPKYTEISFPGLPEGLTPRPTLVWLLESDREGPREIEATYLTSGLNWQADYILHVNATDTLGDLKGWVTITNRSGASYEDANVNLIAGQVRRVSEKAPPQPQRFEMARVMAAAAPLEDQFAEQAFFEYHVYKLGRPASIADNETKQLSLLSASGIKLAKEYVVNGQRYYYQQQLRPGEPIKDEVEVALSLRNSTENNLGVPLPGGIVRVYKSDTESGEQFVGEDRIAHVPKDEPVRIRVGSAFDIVAERLQTDFQKIADRVFESAFEIALRNRKDEAVTVVVNEPVSGDWQIVNSNCPYKKMGAAAMQFTVPVNAKSEAKLVYRVRVTY
ncbi:MAG: DUF4139 domain-containing protein [Acidobacteria bacterium]|nr:DUF4139 domain-containing protein [Acidobacteriota bacterium]